MLQGDKVSVQSTVELQPLEWYLYLTYMLGSWTKKTQSELLEHHTQCSPFIPTLFSECFCVVS